MYPQSHFLFPFVLGLVFNHYNILSIEQAFAAGIIGVLIDLDHYLGFLYHYKDFKRKPTTPSHRLVDCSLRSSRFSKNANILKVIGHSQTTRQRRDGIFAFNIKHVWNAAVVKHDPIERTFIHHKIGFAFITSKLLLIMLFQPLLSLTIALGYYSHLFLDYINLNIFGWKKVFYIIEKGFVIKLPLHEAVFDILLVMVIGMYFL
ncbi:hypothetical protein HYY69_03860 [Candidatus Woesearchaeota archaeon]|nr:hypothetical protein [Candidatus Woesearchaeota archaeon]